MGWGRTSNTGFRAQKHYVYHITEKNDVIEYKY
jgi:hypothetical protein